MLRAAIRAVGFEADESQVRRLIRHAELVDQGERWWHLTAVRGVGNLLERLTVPAIRLLAAAGGWLPTVDWWAGRCVADVGTGAGYPGIPLAILNPQCHFALIEARGRKCEFLEATVRELELENVEVLNGRAEYFGQLAEHRERYDVGTALAVAKLPELAELVLPLVKVGGVALLPKGPNQEALDAEVASATAALETLGSAPAHVVSAADAASAASAAGDGGRSSVAVVYLMKLQATPAAYPRNPGVPGKRPLA